MTMLNISEAVALNNPGKNVEAFTTIHDKVRALNNKITNLPASVDSSYLTPQRDFYMNESILMRKRQKRMMERFDVE